MPRDGSGNYTLPAGNPVVTGTTIDVAWANPTMSDIALQLNNVLTKDGVVGPSGPFLLADGAVGAPGLSFSGETTMGLYRIGTGILGVATAGVERARLAAGGLTLAVNVAVGNGTSDRTLAVNGPNSGTAGGGSVAVQNNSVSLIGIGNYSNLIGGTYDATPTLYTSGGLRITDGSTTRVTLNAGGNFGIGVAPNAWTGSGGTALEVGAEGTALFGNNTVNYLLQNLVYNSGWIRPRAAVSTYYQMQAGAHTFGYSATGVAGGAATLVPMLTVDGTGVGLGTITPSNLLHLKAATNPIIRFEGATDSGYLDFTDTRFTLSAGGGYMVLAAGNTERARLDANGKFGIGVTPSGANLGVNASVIVSGSSPYISLSADQATTHTYLEYNTTSKELAVVAAGNSNNGYLTFKTGGVTERMRIDTSGRVGVGRTPTVATLELSGNDSPLGLYNGVGTLFGVIWYSGGALKVEAVGASVPLQFAANGSVWAQISTSGVFTYGSNEIGFRNIPVGSNVDGATVGVSNRGSMAYMDTGGGCTIPASTFAAGDTLSLLNNTGSSQTITQDSGLTMYLAGTTTTGNRTLANKGIATIWFQTATICYISGPGLS